MDEWRSDEFFTKIITVVVAVLLLGACAFWGILVYEEREVPPSLTLFIGASLVAVRSLFMDRKAVTALNGASEQTHSVDIKTDELLRTTHKVFDSQSKLLEQQQRVLQDIASFDSRLRDLELNNSTDEERKE